MVCEGWWVEGWSLRSCKPSWEGHRGGERSLGREENLALDEWSSRCLQADHQDWILV